jgi:type IV pilus assembly protein PilB
MDVLKAALHLVKAGSLSEAELKRAIETAERAKRPLPEILYENGSVTQRSLAHALSVACGLELALEADLNSGDEVTGIITEQKAKELGVLPLFSDSKILTVAMAEPWNRNTVEELAKLTGMEIRVCVAAHDDLLRAIDRSFGMKKCIEEAVSSLYGTSGGQEGAHEDESGSGAPVITLVEQIIERAVRFRASDIHIEPYESGTKVRFRVDGLLSENMKIPASIHGSVIARIKIMCGADIAEKRRPQDGRILLKCAGEKIDIRVSTIPSICGEKCVLRLLPQSGACIGLDGLGFDTDQQTALERAVKAPYGIFLVTGPTGSGKSTTLYSMLNLINRAEYNVVTIEDPVEYTMDGITQIQVNERVGLTFESALRSIFRQDPDKLMVGEIRDVETAGLAVRLALTGHLVLSTLHTNNAPGAVNRLLDMGVPSYLLAATMTGVASQRLVRKLCPKCKREAAFKRADLDSLPLPEGATCYEAVGCSSCSFTGYSGRTAVAEIMTVDGVIREMIGKSAPEEAIRNYASSANMKSLKKVALEKVLNGVTTLEEMYKAISIG